ncbi:MAG: 3-phosphoshikimate 1-carboxyvinyltransferase [Syntrophobacter sp.]
MIKAIRRIAQASKIDTAIRLPGSKSITHRALMMASLASGQCRIINPLKAEDTLLTARALEQLGASIDWRDDSILVTPALRPWRQPDQPIYLGNSGTSTRFLVALAAAGSGTFVLDGTPRLRERPVGPVAEALQSLGAKIRWLGKPGYPPIEISGTGLSGGDVPVDASKSSQFLSGLLLAAPAARGDVRITWHEPAASFPYILMTLAMMRKAGIRFDRTAPNTVLVPAPQTYAPGVFSVEGDCSSASYFWGAAGLTGGSVFTAPVPPDSLQGDCRFLGVIEKMGCRIEWQGEGVRVTGPDHLTPIHIDMNEMPDMVPTLAVMAAFAQGISRIENVSHLRIKESDRLEAVSSGLLALGVKVDQLPDGLVIHGGNPSPPSRSISAFDDHRIAMAFALAGLRVNGVTIEGAESVAKSFPEFWEYFERLDKPTA